MSRGPLSGITVVENASYISGPYGGLLLAQLGADVVKVESPRGGDPFRRWGGAAGRRVRPQFAALNYGKRSVTLDLRTAEGVAGYLGLLDSADAVIENFRPGTLDRLGVGEAVVRDRNPGIVYCTVTGFGQTGPYRDRPAYDAILQAVSGLWGLLSPVSAPRATGPPLSDTVSGVNAALAVVAGLLGAARATDAPLRYDVSMLSASLNLVGLSVANFAETGEVEGPYSRGRRSHSIALRCGDRLPLAVHLSSPEKFWIRLTDALGRPELRVDPRFETYPARLEHFEELVAELESALAAGGRDHWLERLHDADVPAAPINAIDDVVADPHIRETSLLVRATGPGGESFLVPRSAIAFAGDLDACDRDVPALVESEAAS